MKEQKIDLVVMGTKGASGVTEILIGSNTADVIEKCHCPVLAIPAESDFKTPTKVVLQPIMPTMIFSQFIYWPKS